MRVTSSHSVFVWENGDKRLKRGDEIRPGDYVLAPARLPFGGRGEPVIGRRASRPYADGRAVGSRVVRHGGATGRLAGSAVTQSVPAPARPSVAVGPAKSAPVTR